MASTNLAIHIPPDANPVNISALVDSLAQNQNPTFPTVQELLEFAEAHSIGNRTEMQSVATKLGLLERTEAGIKLSANGISLSTVKETCRGDILHFLMYTCWDDSSPMGFLPSWSYRSCCDFYWEIHSAQLNDEFLDQLVEDTLNRAEITFAQLGVEKSEGISFSRKSIVGCHNWLDGLNPPVIVDKSFSRRAFCPPELLLLAIGYVVRDMDAATDTDVLLSREKREAICRICLLEPDALDRALDWMIPIFPEVIKPGTSAGYYGRFVRLLKIPTLMDIVR